ncbi:unnamed protein product [Adineta steineri]|uniref:G-protein coupled receptors family 1 profile domain-containing protein n=1 Tax=Adineta steineri TaxID=433720 RepID=A0A813M691_9BILA|nr:unnamed protein product [Adineta steineri]
MSWSLIDVRLWMIRYITSFIWAFGFSGNLIIIYVFTRKNFLRNSCVLYLLAASIINILSLSWGILQSLYNLDHIDPTTYSFVYCKLRQYINHTLLMIGRSLIVFACIDRYAICNGSARFRSFCQPKLAIRMIIAHIFIWPIITVHIAIEQVLYQNQCIMTSPYIIIYGFYSAIVAGIIPPVLMTIFSLLTIRHRRELRTRLNAGRINSRNDHTFTIMLFSQVFVYIITTSLFPAITLYKAITNTYIKSARSLEIETFVNFFSTSFLVYLNPASALYVYIASSKGFRKEFNAAFTNLSKRIIRRRIRVEPARVLAHDIPLTIRNTDI